MSTPNAAAEQGVFSRLYTGTGAFDIVGKRKTWYIGFSVLILICVASIVVKGFNLGIDFTGGSQVQFPARTQAAPAEVETVRAVFEETLGREPDAVQSVGTGDTATIQIKAQTLTDAELISLREALFEKFRPIGANGEPDPAVISDSAVSGTWGGEITRQALIALGVFLVLVTLFLALYFERAMAVAAIVALLHDVVVTAGVYSLVGFEVTPATVIGLLTILGFSLYDTVVVFDKVKENTRGLLSLTRRTYAEAANLAVNQTLMRSINTSLIAVLPVLGLLVVGVGLLGVGTLADLALVQMVGIIAGVLSSILLATPLLVDLKMRDKRYRDHTAKVLAKRRKRAEQAAGSSAAGSNPAAADDAEPPTEALPVDEETAARRERAMAAAAGVPARAQRQRPGSRAAARPTGKRRR
ncbi:preprotein translocase subunit SecF [Pseudonocardia thermophila]|jgi:protein-export membrane protein, SecD/SecF family|uniref:Protein-export membrane protein SecF n=1 Tax=Pseudonocardia thermophila TaxID=1848 RepID=A0A1M6Z5G4_PSETH|nr:protein translocase subunit SecF [Pseudonocardia thermophila]SHL25615.1 preprotein translocase subunit SecF [Pseudonocardia thermophila]